MNEKNTGFKMKDIGIKSFSLYLINISFIFFPQNNKKKNPTNIFLPNIFVV